jgi:hypothetical protein
VADDKKPEDMSDKEYLEWKKRRRAENQWKEMHGQSEREADSNAKHEKQVEKSYDAHAQDVLGADLRTVRAQVNDMPEGPEKKTALEALAEVDRAMKPGWFSRPDPQHVRRVMQQNQGKLAKRDQGWCAVIGVIGIGVTALEAAVIGAGIHDLVSGVIG